MLIDPYKNFFPKSFNPNFRNLSVYREILTKDTMVVYAYDFVRRGIVGRLGEYVNENPDIKEFVDNAVVPAIKEALPSILSAIYWGVSISELVKKPVGDEVHLAKIYTACADLWWGSRAWEENEYHELESVNFVSDNIPIYDENGIQQLAVYTYRPEYSDYYGFATATQVYPYWYVKSRLLSFYAIYLEKNASPTKVFKTDGNDDERIQSQERNSGTAEAVIVSKDTDVDIIESSHAAGEEFKDGIDLMDKYILLSFYIPRLAVDEGVYSTRAQAEVHNDVYLKSELTLANNTAEWLVQNIVSPMVILNYGHQEEYGSFAINDGNELDMQQWSGIIKNLKDVELFNAGIESHMQWASEKFGIPMEEMTMMENVLEDTHNGEDDLQDDN